MELTGTIIFDVNEEVNEIFFISSGEIDIGFMLDKRPRYIIRLTKEEVVGAQQCTFDGETMFRYNVNSTFKGYIMRKLKWRSILDDPEFRDVATSVK